MTLTKTTNARHLCFQSLRFRDTYIAVFFVGHFRNLSHVRRLCRPKRRYTFPFFRSGNLLHRERAFKVLSNRRTNVHRIFLVSPRSIAHRCCDSLKSQTRSFPFLARVRLACFKSPATVARIIALG